MTLPKGLNELGAQAKQTAAQIARPVTSRIDDVKDQVATKEGLQNIAFSAGGNDPTIGISTGIALGIAGLGIGLGAKGLKRAFRGVKGLFTKAQKDNEPMMLQDDQDMQQEKAIETLDELADILRDGLITESGVLGHVDSLLQELKNLAEEQLIISEGVLTKAQQERLENKRQELEKLENEREAIRAQAALLEAVEDVGQSLKDGSIAGIEGKSSGEGLTFAKLLGAGATLEGVKLFAKNIFSALGKGALAAIKRISLVPLALGFVNAGIEAFNGAFEGEGFVGKLQGLFTGFVSGFLATILNLFGFNVDAGMIREQLNQSLTVFKNVILNFSEKIWEFSKEGLEFAKKGIMNFGTALGDLGQFLWQEFKEEGDRIFSPVMDAVSSWFNDILDSTKSVIFGIIRKIPGFEDAFMTDLEKQRLARQERLQELNSDQLELDQEARELKRKELSTGFLGIGAFDEEDRARRLAEIRSQRMRNDREMEALREPIINRPDGAEMAVARLVADSREIDTKESAPAVITVAPAVNTQNQNTNVNNTMIAPLNVKNNESTLDRMIRSDL